jgi:hypothetical protein
MSDFTTILLTLAIFGLMIICMVPLMKSGHQRMDQIVTGIVDGVPVSKKYRWLMLFYGFWADVLVGMILVTIFGTGFHKAADVAANPGVEALANFCAISCGALIASFLVLCLALTYYMGSVVRETKRV